VDGEEHQQGTRRYFEEIRRMMQRRQGDPDAVQAARALRSADPSNVRYILLHTRFSEATPASFVVHAREFELDTPN
jgi:hypothetical protein